MIRLPSSSRSLVGWRGHRWATVVRRGTKKQTSSPSETMSDIPYYFQEQQQTLDNDARMVSPDATSTAAGMTAGNQPYVTVPQYPVAPSQSAEAPSFWSQIPPLVWIGIGVLMANVIGSAIKLVKGGPQKMQEMAMEQMMKQMMNQAMKGAPGGAAANPFAAAGGANPFGSGFPTNFPSSMPSSSSGASMQPPIETTAGPASTASTTEPKVEQKTSTTAEQASSYTPTDSQTKEKRKSAFVDVDATPAGSPSGASSTTTTSTSTSSSSASQPAFEATATQSNGGSQANGASGVSGMLDMLKNPEMQKMLYPYLPEPMRNPETFEWMLNSPEYRDQLEAMLSQQMGGVAPPDAVQELMKDADMNPDKMKAQFDALGMSPEEFVSKVMSDSELAASMTKPSVMAAIAECTKNPMSIFKYQNDEEVMRVFEKMSTLFPQAANMSPGAFPGGMPQPPAGGSDKQ